MNSPASIPSRFQCLRTHQGDGGVQTRLESIALDALSAGELVVRTRYAGLNYKDSLSLLGRAKIVESYPRICGIELVGDVVAVADGASRSFEVGQTVLVHGFRTGIAFDGGFSEYVRVPAAHAMTLPAGLSAYQCAVLGVPGFTVAMALDAFERHGVKPNDATIAVTGAAGAVGTLAIGILSAAGYRVAAVTRRPEQSAALLALGAGEVIDAAEITASTRPLEKPRFAASIDNVGGSALSWLLRSTREGGCVASVGNAGGNAFDGSVLPFIMRGISLFGVVANAGWDVRKRLWGRLGSEWKPTFSAIEPHVHEIRLSELAETAGRQLEGRIAGRTLVRFD
ncbi:YhdH/YhfP family quinone oxidoreductase [Variovorax sp. GT1P44]|uniref:YhdH/YhfP family quinone oxidoreductase n=1 Tax=Variovorax sp. GT1P44 TaxID=3443742 RepID=UPI003F45D640